MTVNHILTTTLKILIKDSDVSEIPYQTLPKNTQEKIKKNSYTIKFLRESGIYSTVWCVDKEVTFQCNINIKSKQRISNKAYVLKIDWMVAFFWLWLMLNLEMTLRILYFFMVMLFCYQNFHMLIQRGNI